jgi:hypothetical protein
MTATSTEHIIRCACCRLKHFASDFGNTRLNTTYRTCKRCRSKNKRRYATAKAVQLTPPGDTPLNDKDKKLLMAFKEIFFNENHIMNIINGICLTLPQRQLLQLHREYNGREGSQNHLIRFIDSVLNK